MGVTPKSWLTPKHWLLIWNFVFREHLHHVAHVEKNKKMPCKRMRKHAFAGWNTQQSCILPDAPVCNGNMRQCRHVELVDVTRSSSEPQKRHNANLGSKSNLHRRAVLSINCYVLIMVGEAVRIPARAVVLNKLKPYCASTRGTILRWGWLK